MILFKKVEDGLTKGDYRGMKRDKRGKLVACQKCKEGALAEYIINKVPHCKDCKMKYELLPLFNIEQCVSEITKRR